MCEKKSQVKKELQPKPANAGEWKSYQATRGIPVDLLTR